MWIVQRKNEENETSKGANLKKGKDKKLTKFIEKKLKKKNGYIILLERY